MLIYKEETDLILLSHIPAIEDLMTSDTLIGPVELSYRFHSEIS